jgi:micrococcal nuclease
MANLWLRLRGLPLWGQIPIGIIGGLLVLGIATAPFASPDGRNVVASTATPATTATPSTPAAREATPALASETTTPPLASLPAGDDTTVTRVTDGDTLVVDGGTRIRLIGIDTPELASDDCFSAEATDHMTSLVGPGTPVRLVYDAGRLDRYDRTLAYVYRLSDGLFVNLALAADGFALQLTVPPNVRHAEDVRLAVADARNANRGLWSACQTASAPPAATVRPVAGLTESPTVDAVVVPDEPPAVEALPVVDAGSGCHPSYAGACVPIASDVDCGGGSGNGPAYVYETDIQVIGDDVYGLDGNDNDGIGCES